MRKREFLAWQAGMGTRQSVSVWNITMVNLGCQFYWVKSHLDNW